MVCLNTNISFNKLKLKNNIQKELLNEINDNFHLCGGFGLVKLEDNIKLELNQIIISKINKLVEKKINDLFSNDYFIYKNMDDNKCTYKFKKGKNEDNFCCKNITKNGNKSKYVCTKHNPEHIPKKRNIKNKSSKNKNSNVITKINNKSNSEIINNYKSPLLCINRNNQKKIYKRNKNTKPKKIIIKGIINFKEILKNLLL